VKSFFENEKYKKVIIAFWVTLVIALIAFVAIFVSFSRRLKSTADMGLLTINTITSVVPNDENGVKSASFSQDKSINEVSNSVLSQISKGSNGQITNVTSKQEINENKTESNSLEKVTNDTVDTSSENTTVVQEKPLEFCAPVAGEIITDYADESLIYSKTLDEWTTHLAIDIKANKTSAVCASESGIIKSIKNDPRYGLTIIISHKDGYESVYSNLLSADFFKEGDSVKKGDTIGTVGESASFEIAEVPHLHFEIYKDGESINPTTLLK
jgi:murein DD-endopeptidase MepM/ murein hydrolase activator NlpD